MSDKLLAFIRDIVARGKPLYWEGPVEVNEKNQPVIRWYVNFDGSTIILRPQFKHPSGDLRDHPTDPLCGYKSAAGWFEDDRGYYWGVRYPATQFVAKKKRTEDYINAVGKLFNTLSPWTHYVEAADEDEEGKSPPDGSILVHVPDDCGEVHTAATVRELCEAVLAALKEVE